MSKEQFYIDRLQQVTTYLRETNSEDITIKELEHISNFSYRNLQRIFKSKYQESIGTYITRLKIEQAAKLLLFSKDSVKNISFQVGYANVQALNKGFKKHFGISPTQYRKQKEELLSHNPIIPITDMAFHHLRIEKLETKKVYFKTYKGDYYNEDIELTWDRLEQKAEEQGITINNTESFGIIWDEPIITEDIKCNYDACFVISEKQKIANKKFKIKIIKSRNYAVFLHIGNYKTIGETYHKIFGQWLFKSIHEISEHPFLEFYRIHALHTKNPEEYETEIYVPIK